MPPPDADLIVRAQRRIGDEEDIGVEVVDPGPPLEDLLRILPRCPPDCSVEGDDETAGRLDP
ncbi:hypothetical protein EB835_10800 [Brevibacterium sp. S22]|nr:hypothetical protein EB835_10800 [Brevibacterium sp. S22]